MDDTKNKHCNKCNKTFTSNTHLRIHYNTDLHKTGQRKKRSDFKDPFKCEDCDYTTKNITTMKIHKLNKHSTKEERSKQFTFYCKYCDYGSFSKDSLEIHNNTEKHKHTFSLINQ